MDFAKNLLEKYGWKEGQGLGKHNAGISQALKPSLKFDNTGFGHDKAADFNDHWWERVFNEAANNLDVNKNNEEVKVRTKDPDSVEITTKNYSVKKLTEKTGGMTYGSFLKSSTLTRPGEEVEEENKINVDDFKKKVTTVLTDEELFKACGGRTAHKGARHGLKLSGKLARIQAQENEFAQRMQDNQTDSQGDVFQEWVKVKSRKSKSKHHQPEPSVVINAELDEEDDELRAITYQTEYQTSKSRKKIKKQKEVEKWLANAFDTCTVAPAAAIEDLSQESIPPVVVELDSISSMDSQLKAIRKKNGKKRRHDVEQPSEGSSMEPIEAVCKKKKRKPVVEVTPLIVEHKDKHYRSRDAQNELDRATRKRERKFRRKLDKVADELRLSMTLDEE